MRFHSFARPIAALALPLALGVTGCVETGPTGTPSSEPSRPGEDPDVERGAELRVTGSGGGAVVVGADGLVHAEVRAFGVEALRTLGFDVVVDGAEVREWSREDAFLRSAGGKLVALESRLDGGRLSIVVGTTAPVSSTSAEGEVVASLVLAPTSAEVRVSLDTSGDMRGLLDASGARLPVTPQHARAAARGE